MPGELPSGIEKQLLAALPLDLTFVDARDVIRYYSDYRIFTRTPAILGTTVLSCHPPRSHAGVAEVIRKLRSGEQDCVELQADKDGRPVRIRYLAVRAAHGEYLGLLEVAEWVRGAAAPSGY